MPRKIEKSSELVNNEENVASKIDKKANAVKKSSNKNTTKKASAKKEVSKKESSTVKKSSSKKDPSEELAQKKAVTRKASTKVSRKILANEEAPEKPVDKKVTKSRKNLTIEETPEKTVDKKVTKSRKKSANEETPEKPVDKKVTKSRKESANEETSEKLTSKKDSTKKVVSRTTRKKATKEESVASKETTKKATSSKSTAKRSSRSKKSVLEAQDARIEVLEYYDLPYRYNQTVVKALAQTPTTLFIYWDIADDDRKKLVEQYGSDFFNNTKPVLIIHNNTLHYSFEVEIDDFANSWYLHVNDSNCEYSVELGRRAKFYNETRHIDIPNNYLYVTSSNTIDSPNDHILFDKNVKTVYFMDVKTNIVTSQDVTSISFLRNMGKIYNLYDVQYDFNNNNCLDSNNLKLDFKNPSSGNPSSTFAINHK